MVPVGEKADGIESIGVFEKPQWARRALGDLHQPDEDTRESHAKHHEAQISALAAVERERAEENHERREQRKRAEPGGAGRHAEWRPWEIAPNQFESRGYGFTPRQTGPDSRWQGDQLRRRDSQNRGAKRQRPAHFTRERRVHDSPQGRNENGKRQKLKERVRKKTAPRPSSQHEAGYETERAKIEERANPLFQCRISIVQGQLRPGFSGAGWRRRNERRRRVLAV